VDVQVDTVDRVDVADPLLEQDPRVIGNSLRRPRIRTSGVSVAAGPG
jgi:hypothetical protein